MNTNPPNVVIEEYGASCYTCTENCLGVATYYLESGDDDD